MPENRRTNLNDESGSDDVSGGDAIDLSTAATSSKKPLIMRVRFVARCTIAETSNSSSEHGQDYALTMKCCIVASRRSLNHLVSQPSHAILMLMRSALRLAFIAIGGCAYAGLAVLGWGGFRPFFSHPALIALVVVLFALSGVAFFAGGNLSRWRARGPQQPVGHSVFVCNRISQRVFAGIHGSQGAVDDRW